MTYTIHRNTQDVLTILESLDLDVDKASEESIMAKFGLKDEYEMGELTAWQKVKPRIYALFDEPYSSVYSRVILFFNENEMKTVTNF